MSRRSVSPWLRLAGAAVALWACTADAPPSREGDGGRRLDTATAAPPAVQLIDSTIPPAVAGAAGWGYQQSASADLAGDAQVERVVLTARVDLVRGRPAWDDGQPWQVYIEAQDGSRTYVYARRLQLGTLAMRVSRSEPGRPASIVLLEHLPDRLTVYEVSYAGPGRATAALLYQRDLDPRGEVASPPLP